jgi:predicted TIM-barrel fold metal-dependent hydrolase
MIIDWQHHFTPEEMWKQRGGKPGEDVYFYQHGKHVMVMYHNLYMVEKHLDDMDAVGIDVSVFSETTYTLDECRIVDNAYAELMKRYPRRIVCLAPGLPLMGQKGLDELDRAINELGLRGVMIAPQRKGIALDSQQFWPFYQKVSELKVPIFVHISPAPRGFDALDAPYNLNETFAREFDLATAIARVCLSGVLENFPDLKFVFAHLGGGIAAIRDRLEQYMDRWGSKFWLPDTKPEISKPFSYYFDKIYVDTAGSDGRMSALKCALTSISPKRILFATDYPYDFAGDYHRIRKFIEDIRSLNLDERSKESILGGNAADLLGLQ